MGFLFGGPKPPQPAYPDPAAALAAQQAQARQSQLQAREASGNSFGRADTESAKSGALGVASSPLGTKTNTLF